MPTATEPVLAQRLATQRLTAAPLATPGAVVDLLTCVQSQEPAHALFSLGLRTRDATMATVRAALDAGEFVRTHVLRPTWHFIRPADLRWILALTSPRVERAMTARHRELELDDPRFVARALDALTGLLAGRNHLTRAEIGARGRPDLPEPGPRLGHLLMVAELRGLVCSGPSRRGQHSYALVDEVVPPTVALEPDEALARLVHRFFAGHGPASAHDFARWSWLTVGDARRGLAMVGAALERIEVEGTPLWFDPSGSARRRPDAPEAWLLPTYDEVVLTYPQLGFPPADGHPASDRDDPFWARVVCGTSDVGKWKRTVAKGRLTTDVRLADSVGDDVRAAVRRAEQRLADFLELPLDR